ncbi:MAG TPA: energy-coupling factor transporter transmembrane component T, partial [Gemmataceae bacterium]
MTLRFDPPPVAESAITRLDPRWKLAALALAAAAAATVQSPGPAVAALAGALLLAAIARLPGRWFFRRLGALAVALVPFAVVMPLVQGWEGARLAGLLAAKAGAVVTLALVALGTAPVPVTLHAAQALRLPGTLVHVLLLSYRYLFVLADELDRLRRALRVRGFRPRLDRHTYRTVGHVVGTLVVRGAERAEGVAHAMRCRGFDGRFRSLAHFRTAAADVAFFA